jgi:tetratricopeptide (TPR) repeat protein
VIAPVDISSETWIQEQTRWNDYYLLHLQEQLAWATTYAQQPARSAAHCESLLALVEQARSWPRLYARAAELVAALGAWPARWGYWDIWEEMLRFALAVTDSKQDAARYFSLLVELAFLLLDTGRLNQALEIGLQVVEQNGESCTSTPLARAVALVVQILIRQGKMEDAQHVIEQVEQQLRQATDASGAWAYLCVARAAFLRRQGNLEEALSWADQAVAAAESPSNEDLHLRGDVCHFRGVMRWARGEYVLAAADMNRAAMLYANSGDRFAEAHIQGNLGLVYWSLGELDQAENLFRQMIATAEQQGARWQMAVTTGNLGLVCLSRGKLKQSLEYSEQHLRLATLNQDVQEMMRARGIRGTTLLHLGNFVAALADLDVERVFCEKRGSPEGIVCNYVSYARCLAALGRGEQALALAQRALDIARNSSPSMQVLALRSLAEQSPVAQQEPPLKEALNLACRMGRQLDQAACLLSLAVLKKGEEQTALWTQGERLLKRMGAAAWLKGHSPQNSPQIVLAG